MTLRLVSGDGGMLPRTFDAAEAALDALRTGGSTRPEQVATKVPQETSAFRRRHCRRGSFLIFCGPAVDAHQ
jgi:hypothetical protein